MTVASILTQGRDNYSHWVQTYQVSYSDDGTNFHDYELGGVIAVGPNLVSLVVSLSGE